MTCPTVRIHPAVIAQAAATSAVLLEGRFSLGVGSGEALNEHILGDRWPEADVRLEMLEEAVEVIRTLWQGGQQSHHGRHYTVENARVYDLPDAAAAGPRLRLRPQGDRARGRDRRRLRARRRPTRTRSSSTAPSGGTGPVHAGTKVCFMADEDEARETVAPAVAQRGAAGRARAGPAHARALRAGVRARHPRHALDRRSAPTSTSTSRRCRQYADAGVDELFVQQIGPEQDAFFDLGDEILPQFAGAAVR